MSHGIKYVAYTSATCSFWTKHGERPQRGACIKHCVENFVIRGGYLPLFETDDGRFLDAGDITDKLPYEIMEKARSSQVIRCGIYITNFCSRCLA